MSETTSRDGSPATCQVAADLAISQGSGQPVGHVSRDLANLQVRVAGASATNIVGVPTARELAIWVETNSRWSVSGQLANGQVSSMNSGQTKGDLTPRLSAGR